MPLLDKVFVDWPHIDVECSPLEFWGWKYKGNPMPEMLHSVALVDGRIVGCCHVMPLKIKIGGASESCLTNVDLAVHADHRQRGLMNRIGDTRDQVAPGLGFQIGYNITGNPILVKVLAESRARFPFDIVNLVRIRDIDLQLEKMPVGGAIVKKAGFLALRAFNRIQTSLASGNAGGGGVSLRVVDRFDDRIGTFWDEAAKYYDFIVERKKEYLNWKYCDPRVGRFRVVLAEERGRVIGYCVSRINAFRADYPVGFIVDIHALPGCEGVVEALAGDAVRCFDESGVNIINCQLVRGHPYVDVMERLGFLDSRVEFHMFYQFYGASDPLAAIASSPAGRVYVSWGDHDVLPVKMPAYKK